MGRKPKSKKATWRENVESILVAVVLALSLRGIALEAFKIPSGSMISTLAIGDQIFVNKLRYGFRIPFTTKRIATWSDVQRGDVIVFICPLPPNDDYIKRVVAVAGDEIRVVDGIVYLNGEPLTQSPQGNVQYPDRHGIDGDWYRVEASAFTEQNNHHTYTVLQETNVAQRVPNFGPYVVPDNHVFVMGDNRDHSFDSRSWGPVPVGNILGKAMFIWWSWGADGVRFFGQTGLNVSRLGTWIE